MRPGTLILALLAFLLIAGEPKTDQPPEKQSEKDRLQGIWNITSVEFNGKPLPDGPDLKQFKGVRLTFEGDQVINSRTYKKSTFTLDKNINGVLDIVESTPEGDHKMLYLYKLDGDTLKLCFTSQSGTTRPTELTSVNKQIVVLLKRRKI